MLDECDVLAVEVLALLYFAHLMYPTHSTGQEITPLRNWTKVQLSNISNTSLLCFDLSCSRKTDHELITLATF